MKNNYVAERYIAGSLLHPRGLSDRMPDYIERGITADHFEDITCKRIWSKLERAYQQGRMHDGETLPEAVAMSGASDAGQSAADIIEVRGKFQSDEYIGQHLQEIEELTYHRRVYRHSKNIEKAYDDGDIEKAQELLKTPPLLQAANGSNMTPQAFLDELDGMIASKPENVIAMKEMARDAVFILPGIAMAGQYTIINARFNTGKTLLTLWKLSQRDMELTKDFKIFYINADDTFQGGIEKSELAESIGVHSMIPNQCGFEKGKVSWLMRSAISTKQAGKLVLILDTLKKFADMMDKKEAREFNLLVRDFVMAGGTVIALAHTNKNAGTDGKAIAEGVGDWASDCDCNYIMDGVDAVDNKRAVTFKLEKLRGPNVMEANFTYDSSEGKTWRERFDSVEQLAKGEAKSMLSDLEAENIHKEDMPVIQYLEGRIYSATKPINGSTLTQTDLEEGLPSRRDRERVLTIYADTNPRKLHQHWRRRTGKNNVGFVFTPPESFEPF